MTDFLAICHFKSAFQSDDHNEFLRRMGLAKESYERLGLLYQATGSAPAEQIAEARGLFASFWLEEDLEIRRRILERCTLLSTETAQILEEHKDRRQLAETLGNILAYSREALLLATQWGRLNEEFERTVNVGRKAIFEFEALGNDERLLEALHNVLRALAVEAQVILEPAKFEDLAEETKILGRKIAEASERIGTAYARSLAKEAAGDIAWDVDGDLAKAHAFYEGALSQAKETGDSFIIGRLCAILALLEHWRALGLEDAAERSRVLEQGLELAGTAVENLKVSLHRGFLAVAYSSYARCYMDLADLVDTVPGKKRAHLVKAIEMAEKGMSFDRNTGTWQGAAHEFSKAMYFLSMNSKDPDEKARLLKEALPAREETVRVTDLLQLHSWSRGVMRNYLALLKAELAVTKQDPEERFRVLREAVSDMGECVRICENWSSIVGSSQLLSRYNEWHGDALFRLFTLSFDPKIAQGAIDAYHKALSHLADSGFVGPVGPIHWKIARVHDALGEFRAASDEFRRATQAYKLAGTRIPGVASAFGELANHMEAWATIEEARLHHSQEDFGPASEKYAEAAKILGASRTWRPLAGLCTARSLLERAEAQSSEEKHISSLDFFERAAKGFGEVRREIERHLRDNVDPEEQQDLNDWLKLSSQRETYCSGRIALEQAKVLDKRGKKNDSARKYMSACDTFKSLSGQIEGVQDLGELEVLAEFCAAWAKMKEAESKVSPELYAEAAESFLGVRGKATREQFGLLALADASICKALEAGTRFRLTRDTQLYSNIKKHLETAAEYYREAGFKKTESWTRATQRLFDALVYLSDAELEIDPKKKTELYHLSEKHLELAAKLYGEAGFPGMREDALEHLGRVREEKQVLLAPLEILSEMPTASTGSLVSATLRGRQPSGVERFEEAYVVGDMNIPQRELSVGSDFTIELEAANVGRTPATLVKLQDIVPEGLELDSQRTPHRIEDSFVDLEGKRLEHLKTHQVKVILKTSRKGVFELRPRLFFVDDRGNYKSYRFQASTLTVTELEVPVPTPLSGEMAPPKMAPAAEFRFETERAREVFHCLVKEFLSDYMSKRIYVEKAGWRSLMDLVREMKIPRSALYGPGGRDGPTLSELERRGLVESRIFPKERGRGGAIKKVRVAYDNAIVKKIVEQTVVENK